MKKIITKEDLNKANNIEKCKIIKTIIRGQAIFINTYISR